MSFGPGKETVVGLVFGRSKEGSQCSMKKRTKPARGRVTFHRRPRQIMPRALSRRRLLLFRRLRFFTRSLIAAWSQTGPSNGASDGADAPTLSKMAGSPGGTPKHRRLSRSGTRFAIKRQSHHPSSQSLRRAPSTIELERRFLRPSRRFPGPRAHSRHQNRGCFASARLRSRVLTRLLAALDLFETTRRSSP